MSTARKAMMSRTEAAETVAVDMIVFARNHGSVIGKDLAEARVSELRCFLYAGTYKGEAAHITTPVAALRAARRLAS